MWEPWIEFAIAILICLAGALIVTIAVTLITKLAVRKVEWPKELVHRCRRPFRVFVLVIALWVAVGATFPDEDWKPGLSHLFLIVTIAVGTWLAISLIMFGTDQMLGRYRLDVPDNRVARRIRTQTLILRRLAIAIVVVIAIGSILLTFPQVQAIGASVLASAGIASIVAGLAAQSTLANMFAGIQLVFSEALRVDDVVVVEGEWGRVGEITLSYVVVNLWDERRLIVPCTYFTQQAFTNWTRRGSEILGTVELDLDWRVPVEGIRERLDEVLADTDLWDGRSKSVQVTDATGGHVQVRIVVSAANASLLWDLRCLVREELVAWARTSAPASLPVQRVELSQFATVADAEKADAPESTAPHPREGLFSGSEDADRRAAEFTAAIPIVRSDEDR
ncbi:mechanosensitive ion channel [Microbacterium awajiense]|uniref:Mechanosensitive ion channel n=1 Tax=Microbacterium awajiense TaxID=415214 RepID=A0ABP7AWZ4_9MICO